LLSSTIFTLFTPNFLEKNTILHLTNITHKKNRG